MPQAPSSGTCVDTPVVGAEWPAAFWGSFIRRPQGAEEEEEAERAVGRWRSVRAKGPVLPLEILYCLAASVCVCVSLCELVAVKTATAPLGFYAAVTDEPIQIILYLYCLLGPWCFSPYVCSAPVARRANREKLSDKRQAGGEETAGLTESVGCESLLLDPPTPRLFYPDRVKIEREM